MLLCSKPAEQALLGMANSAELLGWIAQLEFPCFVLPCQEPDELGFHVGLALSL